MPVRLLFASWDGVLMLPSACCWLAVLHADHGAAGRMQLAHFCTCLSSQQPRSLPWRQSVLVSGKPHLGTDRLVRILKAFRQGLALPHASRH